MWTSFVNYPNEQKETIKKSLPYLKKTVFFNWKFPPTFKVRSYDEEEFSLHICYTEGDCPGEKIPGLEETMHGHEALNLAESFIYGLLFYLKYPNKIPNNPLDKL